MHSALLQLWGNHVFARFCSKEYILFVGMMNAFIISPYHRIICQSWCEKHCRCVLVTPKGADASACRVGNLSIGSATTCSPTDPPGVWQIRIILFPRQIESIYLISYLSKAYLHNVLGSLCAEVTDSEFCFSKMLSHSPSDSKKI